MNTQSIRLPPPEQPTALDAVQQAFPWIHPRDWEHPQPNASVGSLDTLQTKILVLSELDHSILSLIRPNPNHGPYDDEIIIIAKFTITDDDYKTAANSILHAYFDTTQHEPECWFTTHVVKTRVHIPNYKYHLYIEPGTPIIINPNQSSLGIPVGKTMIDSLCSYPRPWIHPAPATSPQDYIKAIQGQLAPIPPEAHVPPSFHIPPDLNNF